MERIAFTVTKIQPPRPRASLIERAALELRLGEAIATRRLTLLSAPAGFGKTTALTRQLASLRPDTAVAWIAADEDDDLHRFLLCLFKALEPYDLPWRTEPESLIAAAVDGRPDRRVVVTEVVNALAEFRQSELRFGHDEVAALVAAAGVTADASQLANRTSGWAAGLRLALNAARLAGPASQARQVDRHVFDYLAAEVVDRMRPELRDFLIRCSVLPELSAARCAALTRYRNTTSRRRVHSGNACLRTKPRSR